MFLCKMLCYKHNAIQIGELEENKLKYLILNYLYYRRQMLIIWSWKYRSIFLVLEVFYFFD